MLKVRGMERPLPLQWNRSRAAAVAVTLLMHFAAAVWLLSVRIERLRDPPAAQDLVWLPFIPEPPRSPPLPEPRPGAAEVVVPTPPVVPMPEETESHAITLPDWAAEARAVASQFGRGPEIRRFGSEAEEEPRQLRSRRPPHSVFDRPLPRVGTTVRTPDGEQLLWVSDNCYISLGTQSLTLADVHAGREGVRTCQYGVGRRKARDDLFDPLRKPQQEPGCGAGSGPRSCPP
ncbi:MAG: hypothetical protein ACT4UQ_02865 [Gammaproteobacteria bacterium]